MIHVLMCIILGCAAAILIACTLRVLAAIIDG